MIWASNPSSLLLLDQLSGVLGGALIALLGSWLMPCVGCGCLAAVLPTCACVFDSQSVPASQ